METAGGDKVSVNRKETTAHHMSLFLYFLLKINHNLCYYRIVEKVTEKGVTYDTRM